MSLFTHGLQKCFPQTLTRLPAFLVISKNCLPPPHVKFLWIHLVFNELPCSSSVKRIWPNLLPGSPMKASWLWIPSDHSDCLWKNPDHPQGCPGLSARQLLTAWPASFTLILFFHAYMNTSNPPARLWRLCAPWLISEDFIAHQFRFRESFWLTSSSMKTLKHILPNRFWSFCPTSFQAYQFVNKSSLGNKLFSKDSLYQNIGSPRQNTSNVCLQRLSDQQFAYEALLGQPQVSKPHVSPARPRRLPGPQACLGRLPASSPLLRRLSGSPAHIQRLFASPARLNRKSTDTLCKSLDTLWPTSMITESLGLFSFSSRSVNFLQGISVDQLLYEDLLVSSSIRTLWHSLLLIRI